MDLDTSLFSMVILYLMMVGIFLKKEASLTFDPLLDWLKLHEGKNQQKFCTDWDHTKNYKECSEVVGYK